MKEETSDTLLLLQYVPLPWQDAFFSWTSFDHIYHNVPEATLPSLSFENIFT